VQCTSGTVAAHNCSSEETVSLVFNETIRELTTCTFSLATGRCIDQEAVCMIKVQPSTSTTSSSITTPSNVMALPSSTAGTVNFLCHMCNVIFQQHHPV